jgi:hypothetical protein
MSLRSPYLVSPIKISYRPALKIKPPCWAVTRMMVPFRFSSHSLQSVETARLPAP